MTPPQLWDPVEAAEYLRLTPKTVRDYLRKGKLPGVKVGSRWYVRVDDLSSLLGAQ